MVVEHLSTLPTQLQRPCLGEGKKYSRQPAAQDYFKPHFAPSLSRQTHPKKKWSAIYDSTGDTVLIHGK